MKKRILAILLAAVMVMTVLAGCGNKPDQTSSKAGESKPASSAGTTSEEVSTPEPAGATEFTIACPAAGDVNPPMNEWWIWGEYENMTGIHINWMEIPSTAVAEQKNLLMTSSDKPDAFWQIGFSTDELNRYGAEGSFVNIAPYMEEYAPNVNALLSEIPGGKAAMTMPDGGIYSMPWLMTDLPQMNVRYYLNKNWLKTVGKDVPTTIDELSDVFAAFKAEDANGNGNPDDEYPIYYQQDGIGMLEQQLCGSYGIGNGGLKPISERYYIDDNGQVQFLYTSDGMKQIWQQFADWWSKGYFHPETFGTVAYENWVTDGKVNDLVGMFSWVGADYLYYAAIKDYTPISVLTGPSGEQPVQSWCDYPVRGTSAFLITDACEDPATLLKWADYFYGEEGVTFSAFGKEGVTYNLDEDGKIRYVDEINNYEGGPQLGAFQYGLFVYGGNLPTLYVDSEPMEIARKQDGAGNDDFERMSLYMEESEKYKPDLVAGLIPTVDESTEINAMVTDIDTFIKEARANFVTGVWNFDSDWETFASQLEGLGVSRYVEIKQAQYDRYKEANG